ncbi:MAG: guanylate cyclase [Spirochaetes bacterium RBG_16_49_21]|nr:MAG: guanylate cyclase [Spirochaetes bacterium RBG_16_49_21]
MSPDFDPLKELTRAGAHLTRQLDYQSLISIIVEQTIDITQSDLACLYLSEDPEQKKSDLKLAYRRGRLEVPPNVSADSHFIDFIRDSNEAVIQLDRKSASFSDLLLSPEMTSGIALPILISKSLLGVLILNSAKPDYYNRERFLFLDSFTKLANGMIQSSKLFQQTKDYLKQIEELQVYQENIFSSMTNLLVTTDMEGRIRYFNEQAGEGLKLTDSDIGKNINEVFKNSIDKRIIKAVQSSLTDQREQPEIQGIFRSGREMDFSLNISPLKAKRGRFEGITLLFTDQTRERKLEETVEKVVEERRLIKDMFSRYLSHEVVQRLTESPDLLKPGGDKKEATIFFADIRGYTSFSQGRDPEYIIEILNEYFSEAVEVVIKYKGYIDKFIGDAIMAAWGVPLQTKKEDAILAVSCALEIQNLISSKGRRFFKGEASSLKVGIGMHTGYLVAGNLGSPRRMNYTVIGDTVNIASRLESVAGPGEVIITEQTRSLLDNLFLLEGRKPVTVKGISEAIPIYKVIKKKKK